MNQARKVRWLATAIGLAMLGPAALQAQAVITNGTISLGVNQAGALNITSPVGASIYGGVGLRFNANAWDGTYDGCTCEGWGAGISGGTHDLVWGGQNTTSLPNPITNLSNITFTSDLAAGTATSVSTIRNGSTDVMRVTQAYAPSPLTPNLYQVQVTMENLTGAQLGVGSQAIRFRREMDWDVPIPGQEVVSLTGWGATNLIGTSSNGFVGSNPFSSLGTICGAPSNANFTNIGPCDHGAVFDFAFPALGVGLSQSFTIYYGAAENLAGVETALDLVDAEVASWAFCSAGRSVPIAPSPCTGAAGTTFVFGFGGVGGTPISSVPEPGTVLLTATGLVGMLVVIRRRRSA